MNRISVLVSDKHTCQICTNISSMETQFNFNNELAGKIAQVTGGTKGTGKAIAERLLMAERYQQYRR